jgi:predicted dinucleotide-binding enzyme
VSSIIIFGGNGDIGKIIAEYYIGKKLEVSVGRGSVCIATKYGFP